MTQLDNNCQNQTLLSNTKKNNINTSINTSMNTNLFFVNTFS